MLIESVISSTLNRYLHECWGGFYCRFISIRVPLYKSSWPLLSTVRGYNVVSVLLQNTAHPVNGVYQTPDTSPMSMNNTQAPRKDVQRQGMCNTKLL